MPKPFALSLKLPFAEAIAQAAGRGVTLPADYYGRLPAEARSQAFTVFGLTSLEQIKSVLDSLVAALQDGQTFSQWKDALGPALGGLSDNRKELIFRNAVQTGYNIGRTTQQRENKARRPFYMWDAINDTRTRPEHAAMDGYIAPIDDAIWTRWSPPAGHNCRCTRISLTEAQAKARGYGRQARPNADPDPGWDYEKADGQGDALKALLATRAAAMPAAVQAAVTNLMAKPVTVDDFVRSGRAITATLPDGGAHPEECFTALIARLGKEVGISTPTKVASKGEGARLVREASQRYPDAWTQEADLLGPLFTKAKAGTRGWQFTVPDTLDGRVVRMEAFGATRVTAKQGYVVLRSGDVGNAVHEFAHRLQNALPELDKLFQELHLQRTGGEPLERLRDVVTGSRYASNEVTRKDKYTNPYQGKEYAAGGALEMMTMAFENVLGLSGAGWLRGYRLRVFSDFYTKDREMFDFVVGLLFHWKP